ncbi:MAG: helix-turn-helix domain-containing protein [Kutzneria sp.]|nr:helix-turn-helix domain-containing protein [Kutzneria sp.]
MSRNRTPEQLSVAELVHFGPLSRAHAFAAENLDRQVSQVNLVSELDQIRQCEPHAAVVLHGSAAMGVWAVESALRLAWERNASCVIAPSEIAVTSSTAQLAERLRVPLFVVDDPPNHALELSATVADTEAARARLTARCAVLFGDRSSVRDIVGVINTEVPGVTAALVTKDGNVIAGRSAVGRKGGGRRVQVSVAGPDGQQWAELVAELASSSPSWVETVETILRLARAPLTASIGRSRLAVARRTARERLLLEILLNGGDATEEAEEAGWQLTGRHVAVVLRAAGRTVGADDVDTPAIVFTWRDSFAHLPIVPVDGAWVSWWTARSIEPGHVAERLRQYLAEARLPIALTAGVGVPGEDLVGLRRSITEARLAAAVASRLGGGSVELFGELGPRALLACLPIGEIAAAARVALNDLIAAPDAEVLITALAALLDCAGSTGQAAARLGVHRNTVLSRIERIRARGVDLDSPDQRLALHLACYSLLSTRQWQG